MFDAKKLPKWIVSHQCPLSRLERCYDRPRINVTTSSTASTVPFRSNRFVLVLIALFVLVWLWSAIQPAIPEDWLLENLLVFFLAALLVVSHRWLTLSDLS